MISVESTHHLSYNVIYADICVHTHITYTCPYTCLGKVMCVMCMHTGQRMALVACPCLSTIWDKVSLCCSLPSNAAMTHGLLGILMSDLPSCPKSNGITVVCYCAWLLCGLGIRSPILTLSWRILYQTEPVFLPMIVFLITVLSS